MYVCMYIGTSVFACENGASGKHNRNFVYLQTDLQTDLSPIKPQSTITTVEGSSALTVASGFPFSRADRATLIVTRFV